ncbi:succinyl-diaminopimelate desuccinylase [Oikeobacillus pervagus]|uniref:Succinyl-diaminopimelate desuccinylase n=1 Tax=Oikeobacillus pervagus TaxID=1325931 RepID=A0AAJ1WH23_9BACI|nr:dipeptidase PepV [Oikeobacillus pervagus]MDQ0215747.1 succinyl-diaminopimelate desuccinylase [Oikeobacillus pervagus]
MTQINWMKEVEQRKEALIHDLQSLIRIKSVRNDVDQTPEAPLGKNVKAALDYMLQLGEKDGFTSKNVGNVAGHLEFGAGEDIVGILCHVDVVPEGDGWSVDPFSGEIIDGKIFGRGSLDDKGPTMAAYYAMKIVKELGLPLNKRVRMIIGTDEESDWQCVDHYFKQEEMPTVGFAPDGDFPIIHAEKGIVDYDLVHKARKYDPSQAMIRVVSFDSGRRYNMVPDYAKAMIVVNECQTEFVQRFEDLFHNHGLKGRYHIDNGHLVLELEGVSAHGMEPRNGRNAGLFLADFLSKLPIDEAARPFFSFISHYLHEDSRGRKLQLAYEDEISGDLTMNIGKLSYSEKEGGRIGVNMRYPVTYKLAEHKEALELLLQDQGFVIENFSDSPPHYVDKNDEFIQILSKVYEEQTGEKAELLAIGGGTYARSLEKGVAFGALFPGRADVMHQKDEHMFIEDLFKATAIYAQAIYELTQE